MSRTLVEGLPYVEMNKDNCWTREEARAFLEVARTAGPRQAAFYATALDTGARISELCGLQWKDIDFDAGTVRIARQLLKLGLKPVFGPPKTKRGQRTIDLDTETITLLRAHKQHQAKLKLANRLRYHTALDLMFATEPTDVASPDELLGLPLPKKDIGRREFARLIKTAKVRRITFHGLRHTSATLLLSLGEAVHVVAQRLGHDPKETMNTYAHVLPMQQRTAVQRLGGLLYR